MTNYVLVHGAWHDGWAWDRVSPVLREGGHQVLTPTLPHAPGTTLAEHVAVIREAIASTAQPVTVVAHSYAGVVAPQSVAMSDPAHVEALVLVDGWLTSAGQSLLDVAPDWFGDWCRDSAVGSGDMAVLPPPPASTLGLVDEGLVEFVESRMTAQPMRTFTDRAAVTLDRPALRRYAVTCVPSMWPFGDMARSSGYEVLEIQSDHELMLSHPDAFLEVLASLSSAPRS